MRNSQKQQFAYQEHKGQQYQQTCYESCLECCGNFTGCMKIWCPCVCCCCESPIRYVNTSKIGILQSFGRFKQVLQPGLHMVNPVSQNMLEVDIRTKIYDMPPQTVITKDNVSMKIDTVVYYRTIDPFKLIYKLKNNERQIVRYITEMAYSALRTVVGQSTFQEMLENRDKMTIDLENYVQEKIFPYGLHIDHLFIKDLHLPIQVQKNMQSAAVQRRVSQATIISAQADVECAKMLKEASEILNSHSAMQIRYLEVISNIADRSSSKTMFMSLRGKQ